MKPTGRLLPLLCILVASLALPAAAAADGQVVIPGSFSIEATLPKSNGFELSVTSIGHRRIDVLARRHGEFALYRAHGTADRHGLAVDLGRFGRIRLRFTGHAHLLPNLDGCKGRRALRGIGTLRGRIRFRGREGFASAAVTRVRGRFTHSFRQVCDRAGSELTVAVAHSRTPRAGSARRKFPGEVLEAKSHSGGRTTSFSAINLDLFHFPPLITASVVEKVGGVQLFSFTQPGRESSSLAFGKAGADPETATVRPGAPFAGEASYSKPRGGTAQWTGDLRVPIAGYGTLPLTGTDFHANSCHGDLESFSGCDGTRGTGNAREGQVIWR